MSAGDHDAWVEEARSVSMTEALGPRAAGLKRQGRELVGPCPACGGTDRFAVHLGKGLFHCRGSGEGGDAIALVRYLDGVDFFRACEILTGRPDPRGGTAETEAERIERRRRLAERAAQAEAERVREAAEAASFRERERRVTRELWDAALPLPGTPGEQYLMLRGLACPARAHLRFAPQHSNFIPPYHPPKGQPGYRPARLVYSGPAMLAAITDAEGVWRGLHATWIDLDRPDGKAVIVDPETGEVLPTKKMRGSVMGAHIDLVRVAAPETLVVGEGIETVLSIWKSLLATGWEGLPGAAFRAAGSLGNLAGKAVASVPHPTERITRQDGSDGGPRRVPGPDPDLASPALVVPDSVTHLILLGDGDSEPVLTEHALKRAARRHAERSDGTARTIRLPIAPPGFDFNEVLRGLWQPEEMAA